MQEFGITLRGTRKRNDFYPTEAAATVALANRYAPFMGGHVWEPACGNGAITDVLRRYNITCIGSDLIHRGSGIGGIDFLTFPHELLQDRWSIVTNPPYNIATEFVSKALDTEAPFIAMLLKMSFWNASSRTKLWKRRPPKAIHPLTWRPDFTGQGSPFLNLQWCVWGDVPISNEPMGHPHKHDTTTENNSSPHRACRA